MDNQPTWRWRVAQSAAIEMDIALSMLSGRHYAGGDAAPVRPLVACVPADWREQWPLLAGQPRTTVSMLEYAARIAGVVVESDYGRATLAIRELTTEDALERLVELSTPYGLAPQRTGDNVERFADMLLRFGLHAYDSLNLGQKERNVLIARLQLDIDAVVRIWRDGDRHTRFWHWLDRFYYECYRLWRETRADDVAQMEARAQSALGGIEGDGLPALDWLTPQNPLVRYPNVRSAVERDQVAVVFLAEPFGLIDSWGLQPGLLVVTCAEHSELFDRFREYADGLATRAKALSDPTRLTILRIIRHFGMINTEMADYLDLARPTVSVHAKILRDAGLIRSRQVGRLVKHELDAAAVRQLLQEIEQFLDLPAPDDEADAE